MTCCLTFLLKIYTDFRGGLLADKGMWHIVAFHIFWMESIRLASTLLMPRLWYKARGCYPSPRLRSQFNTQLIAFLASCVLLNNTLRITLRWENSSPYLVPDGNIEHLKIARWVVAKKVNMAMVVVVMAVVRLSCMNNCRLWLSNTYLFFCFGF